MPTSKSSNQGSGPDKRPAIAIDAELAGRLVAALEQLGVAVASDRHPERDADERLLHGGIVDPVRARASRDYEVLRGMLGRADAPTPLRMTRRRSSGDPIFKEQDAGERDAGQRDFSDNRVEVLDLVPLSANYALVESLGDGSTSAVTDKVPIRGDRTPTLLLREFRAALPISRVEIFDVKDKLVAFGPSFGPLSQPHHQPSGGR
jgi:hypothetical protein